MPCVGRLDKYRFFYTNEDVYGVLGKYYGLPVVSFRDAVWHECEDFKPECPRGWRGVMNTANPIIQDWTHPGDIGHRWAAGWVGGWVAGWVAGGGS